MSHRDAQVMMTLQRSCSHAVRLCAAVHVSMAVGGTWCCCNALGNNSIVIGAQVAKKLADPVYVRAVENARVVQQVSHQVPSGHVCV